MIRHSLVALNCLMLDVLYSTYIFFSLLFFAFHFFSNFLTISPVFSLCVTVSVHTPQCPSVPLPLSHSGRMWDLLGSAVVCWELIDSASSLAKVPLWFCHSAQPAAGLEGLDGHTGVLGEDGGLAAGHRTKKKKKKERREGGGLGVGSETCLAGEMERSQSGDLHQTWPRPHQPNPQINNWRDWSDPLWCFCIPALSAGTETSGTQTGQNPILDLFPIGVWWSWLKEDVGPVFQTAQNHSSETHSYLQHRGIYEASYTDVQQRGGKSDV